MLSEDVLSTFCVDISKDHSCAEKRPTALVACRTKTVPKASLHPRKEINAKHVAGYSRSFQE